MKNIINCLLISVLFLTGCSRSEIDMVFDKTPEERMGDQQRELKNQLITAEYGWKAYNETLLRGNYGYYMEFDDKDRVKMLTDINATASTDLRESSYRVRLINGATLAFETYNYINLLNDPNPSVMNGQRGEGLKSDIEFDFQRATADSIFLKGRKYATQMLLVRASQAEQNSYLNGEYPSSIEEIKSIISLYSNPAIALGNLVYSFNINSASKVIESGTLQSDGKIIMNTGKFHFTLDGLELGGGIVLGDITIFGVKRNGTDKLIAYDRNGSTYDIINNPTPIIPLINLFAYNGTFKTLGTPTESNVLPQINVDSDFKTVWQNTIERFVTSGRNVRYFDFVLTNSTTATFNLFYNAGASNFTATVTFNYTLQDGILTLTNPSGHTAGNWNTRRAQIQLLEDFLFNMGPMKMEWVATSGNVNVAGLHSVANPNKILYGILK